ncbi:MAG: helix-turn-helix domain-containing protein [Lachnospiraceae bacterium]|nr:helix-turn-helix domain-containing protein [Lachnospiraceae bacterium]
MILAEKITKLRKRNGWSQEELAMKLNISRQSVSKWESAASIPDLDKVIKLSAIFGVSTDYLLKDELDEEPAAVVAYDTCQAEEDDVKVRNVSLDEANAYMSLVKSVSKRIAAGVMLCILSPVLLILLGGLAEYRVIGMTENAAGGIGLTVLLLMVAGAVALFILYGMKLERYQYMEREVISLQYGVAGIAKAKKEKFEPVFKMCIVIGVTMCILSAVPLFVAAIFDSPDIIYIYCVDVLLVMVAIAVYLFVWSGMIYGSYQRILEEGEYAREKKLENRRNDNLAKVYWCIVAAIYLGYSFWTGKWYISWVIWPVAGVLFAAVCGIAAMIRGK